MTMPSKMNSTDKTIFYIFVAVAWLGCVGILYTVISYYTGL